GQVTWRVQDGLPVIEVVNNWVCRSLADSYRWPVIPEQIAHVLNAVQPDVVHVHNLLNLSFGLPAMAHARGAAVVATLHDYTLVCPSGGQRIHRAERHACHALGLAPLLRHRRRSRRRPRRMGYVGTRVWHKGVHVLIDAVRIPVAGRYEQQIVRDPAADRGYGAELRAQANGLPTRRMGAFPRE